MAIVGCAKCRHTSSDLPLVLHNKDSSVLIKNLSASTPPLIVKEQMEAKDGVIEQIGLQSAVEDSYGGVTVDMKEPVDPKVFLPLLRASISKWRQQGKKGVWIKLPIELASLVAPLVQERFRYHHAESDYLMLVYWIPNTPNTLPENASHRVGIGAFVLNSKRQVLVVKERNGEFKGKGVWKLPTGVVNEGEDICTAAVREVKEETGIETEFVEVLAFRQSHKSFFSKSDLFFICMLQPHSSEILKQDSEIEAAQWMPIEEYVEQSYNKKHQLFKYVAEICKTKAEGAYVGFSAVPVATSSGKEMHLYLNNRDFLANL
ncbi:nudix hydrolase 7 isoform X1 [Jatropha curcas]|uniref:nudix hydrolase 7 isoform X1 n=1 Tax=Jatropha curcas TaxID=180498 RepID=UPI00189608C7|nr:nudix hydrolase 7 isoform X1 [Jatropha curcas]